MAASNITYSVLDQVLHALKPAERSAGGRCICTVFEDVPLPHLTLPLPQILYFSHVQLHTYAFFTENCARCRTQSMFSRPLFLRVCGTVQGSELGFGDFPINAPLILLNDEHS
jgi:hypothetical protein